MLKHQEHLQVRASRLVLPRLPAGDRYLKATDLLCEFGLSQTKFFPQCLDALRRHGPFIANVIGRIKQVVEGQRFNKSSFLASLGGGRDNAKKTCLFSLTRRPAGDMVRHSIPEGGAQFEARRFVTECDTGYRRRSAED